MPNRFHHGDLRTELIENALEMIEEEGEDKLSLRKLARKVGVSEAAPYSHFKNKDDLIFNIREYITDKLYASFEDAYNNAEDEGYGILNIGKAYVKFFLDNPVYFSFLFDQECIKIDLSMKGKDDYKPFMFFRDACYRYYSSEGLSEDKIKFGIINMWSLVHGIASIASMKNVTTDFDWEDNLERILLEKK